MTQPLHRFVGTGASLESLAAHATRLTQLQRHVSEALPPYLAGLCHVANLKDNVLILHAGNGAAAAKLRQAAPRLLNALAAQGIILAAIKVATRPPAAAPATHAPLNRSLSHHTQDGLHELAERLPDGDPLRDALERFVHSTRTRAD